MTNQELDQLRQIPIVDVVKNYIDIKKVGSTYKACCPFHDEKTPSFTVVQNANENFYKCFGCGESGDTISFVQKVKNLSFPDACKELASIGNVTISQNNDFPQRNIETKKPQHKTFEKKYIQSYQKPITKSYKPKESVLKALLSRGISEKTIERVGITESIKYFGTLRKEDVSINFNFYRNGELINVKHRHAFSKNFGLEKDCELILYNLDNIVVDKSKMVIITEGEIDALSIMEAYGEVRNIVSVPNGANSGKNQNLSYLDCPKTKELLQDRRLCLCFDADNAGRNLKDAFVSRFGEENCFIVNYPEGCKDMNDVLLKHDKEAVKEVIEYRGFNKVNGVQDISDFENTVDNYYDHGFPNVDKVGISELDKLIGFRGGELTMVTGISGSGKSVFLDFLMVQLSKIHNWRFAVCSMETPNAIHSTRLATKFINKPFRNVVSAHGELLKERMTPEEYSEAKQFIYHHFHFISHKVEEKNGEKHRGLMNIDYILTQAKRLKAMYGVKGLVIDPWNTLDHEMKNGENETNYVSRVLSKIIAFAEDYDVHVFLVAHPTKGVTNQQGVDRVATLNDISGSGNFFNKTHNGISVFRDKNDDTMPVEAHIQKVKFEFVGRLGVAKLDYDRFTGNYSDSKSQIDSEY